MMGPNQFFLLKLAIVGIKTRSRHKAIKEVKKEHQKPDFVLPMFYTGFKMIPKCTEKLA